MAMTGELLVTPEQLDSTAGEFENIMSNVRSTVDQMLQLANGLTGVWTGEASTAYTTRFNQLDDDMNKIASMIREHVTDLREMAQVYKTAEQQNEELANSLAADVIS